MPGFVVPFVLETDSDAIPAKAPKCLLQSVVEFLLPFASQKGLNLFATMKELGAVAPVRIDAVGQRNAFGITRVPGVFGKLNFSEVSSVNVGLIGCVVMVGSPFGRRPVALSQPAPFC